MRRVVLMVVLPFVFDAVVGCVLALDSEPAVRQVSTAPGRAASVFFYWDDASVSPHARQVLAGVGHGEPARIVAESVADNLQGASYAALLNRRRLNSIVAELVRDGVTAGRITTNPAEHAVLVSEPVQLAGR